MVSPMQSLLSTPFLPTPSWSNDFEVPYSGFQSSVPTSSLLNSSSWHPDLFNSAQTHFPPTLSMPSISNSQNSTMFGLSSSSSSSSVAIFFHLTRHHDTDGYQSPLFRSNPSHMLAKMTHDSLIQHGNRAYTSLFHSYIRLQAENKAFK